MPKPKGAGDLRQRVYFQRRAPGADDLGNAVDEWRDLRISRACSLLPTRGGEQVQAGRVAGLSSWDCWVRYDHETRGLKASDRAVDERDPTQTFNVDFIGDMDGDRQWLLIQMTQGGADG